MVKLTKKCAIIISLVEQAEEEPNVQPEEEIRQALEATLWRIPWAEEVQRVSVTCNNSHGTSDRPQRK